MTTQTQTQQAQQGQQERPQSRQRTVNQVTLLGRVGNDPEMFYANTGTAITKFRLATDRRRANDEYVTDWHNVVCFGNLAEIASAHVGSGDRLYVTGYIALNSWQAEDGSPRSRHEVHANELIFISQRQANGGGQPAPAHVYVAPEDVGVQEAATVSPDDLPEPEPHPADEAA